jgi:hypothetical protein
VGKNPAGQLPPLKLHLKLGGALEIRPYACKNDTAHENRQSGRKFAAQSQRIRGGKTCPMRIARLPIKAKPAKAGDAKPWL